MIGGYLLHLLKATLKVKVMAFVTLKEAMKSCCGFFILIGIGRPQLPILAALVVAIAVHGSAMMADSYWLYNK